MSEPITDHEIRNVLIADTRIAAPLAEIIEGLLVRIQSLQSRVDALEERARAGMSEVDKW